MAEFFMVVGIAATALILIGGACWLVLELAEYRGVKAQVDQLWQQHLADQRVKHDRAEAAGGE
jgi:signal transduction histidine kinase